MPKSTHANFIINCLEICTTPIGIGVSLLGLREEPLPNDDFGGFPWDDHDIVFTVMVMIKGRFKSVECTNKRSELYDVLICCTKFLKYDPSRHRVEGICYVELENNTIG